MEELKQQLTEGLQELQLLILTDADKNMIAISISHLIDRINSCKGGDK